MSAATCATVTGWAYVRWLPSGRVMTGMTVLGRLGSGGRTWDRTTDPYHVKVVLYR